jgi:hypothetical protein
MHNIVQIPLNDIQISADYTLDGFPNEWFNALVWNLADQIAIEFDVPSNHRQEIAARAKMYKEELEGWDVENVSVKFTPDMRAASREFR